MRRMIFVLAILTFGVVAANPLMAQDNPFLGTWKLNVAKSKVEGVPMPKSLTRTVTADGNTVKYSFEGVGAEGAPVNYSFSSSYDGKPSPVTGTGMPGGADSVTIKRVGANKVTAASSKGGKEIGTSTGEVSKDGKVFTLDSKGKTADGKPVSGHYIYEKQ